MGNYSQDPVHTKICGCSISLLFLTVDPPYLQVPHLQIHRVDCIPSGFFFTSDSIGMLSDLGSSAPYELFLEVSYDGLESNLKLLFLY